MDKNHPDVGIYHSYEGSVETLHLRIITMETATFPHGLPLEYTFTGTDRMEKAEAAALLVQSYLNDVKEYWLDS